MDTTVVKAPLWLVERGIYRQHVADFTNEVERQGMACVEVDYRPGRQPPADIVGCPPLADNSCVVLWGTLPLMQQIQLRRGWIPGGWCNVDALDCAAYYTHFSRYLLNSDNVILRGVEALTQQDQLFERFAPGDEVFVRPTCALKIFSGRVAFRDDFRDVIASSRYDPATQIVISSPKEIGREWRLVIANSKIIASSQYRDSRAIRISRVCPDEVLEYGRDVLDHVKWRPDPVFMMDVCESDGKLHLLELNSFSCSGLYDCDLSAVIQSTSEVAVMEWKVKHKG